MAIFPQTIRGKLGSAFGLVAAAAIVGGFVAQSSYDVIGQKLATITEVSVPSVVAAQRIGEVTATTPNADPSLPRMVCGKMVILGLFAPTGGHRYRK